MFRQLYTAISYESKFLYKRFYWSYYEAIVN